MTTVDEAFPFRAVPSFALLVDFWRRAAADPDGPLTAVAYEVLERLEEVPELEGRLDDPSVLVEHRELLELMMCAVVPAALKEEALVAALAPFRMESLYETPAAARMGLFSKDRLLAGAPVDPEVVFAAKTMIAYNMVLKRFYGVEWEVDYPFVLTVSDPGTGSPRHFSVTWDPRFLDVFVRGDPPPLSPDRIKRLTAEPMNLGLWLETLPPSAFEFRGITIATAVDVTDQEVLSRLRDDLVRRDAMASTERVEQLEIRIRALLRRPDLQLGLIAIERGSDIDAIAGARALGKSLLLCDHEAPACPHKADSYYAEAFRSRDPVIVHDLGDCPTCTGFEHHLIQHGVRNLLLHPLRLGDELVGFLEIGSPNPGDLNAFNTLKLTEITSLFATAMKRSLEERDNTVQAIIKQQYTAIHPAVEWRFRDAASNYLRALEGGHSPQPEEIVFPDVLPLYGLTDIRSSSVIRNEAIQGDLVEQLGLALDVVREAAVFRPLPILDDLAFRISEHVREVQEGLRTDDESGVLDLLRRDVEPLFDHLAGFGDGMEEKIRAYRDAVDPSVGMLYRRRRAFEESVALINDTVSRHIDREQVRAQAMFPHYFEKFKTDGVDYSIYVGASLQEDGSYDPMYLRNLRLWQLQMMCRIQWALDRVRPSLPVPLETTHLVLVQDHPLSIRFRADEKQFDVDGAYNIRYEIVKKRIDKARVSDTDERLTQPGTLAIVYSQAREATEYRQYLEYLGSVGFVGEMVENLEVEDLQGIHGLRALRVAIQPEPAGGLDGFLGDATSVPAPLELARVDPAGAA